MTSTRLPARVEVAVIGAGQAGLTMSWHLQQAGREHVLLERRATLGGGWQDRWDAFRLVSPNWTASFPDAPYDGDDPDGFMPRDELIGRVAGYAQRIGAPVVLEAGVERLRSTADGTGFDVETTQGAMRAQEVIVATGGFHRPNIPAIAGGLPPRVLSMHSSAYRREPDLPPGAVLVVGTGQTGCQLVEELRDAGREVYFSGGAAGRAPRTYRGRDVFYWLAELGRNGERLGVPLPNVRTLPDPRRRLAANPQLSGHKGGHDIDLRQMGLDGTTLLGRLTDIDGERVTFAPDLHANLAFAESFFEERFGKLIAAYIEAAGLDCPPAEPTGVASFDPPIVGELDLAREGIATVLWTSGYRQALDWIEPSITDDMGFARQDRGSSELPGLFFIGSLWQWDQTSATLFGVGRDAEILAGRMGLATGSAPVA